MTAVPALNMWRVEIRTRATAGSGTGGVLLRAFEHAPSFPTLTIGDAVFHCGERHRVLGRELHLERDGTVLIYLVQKVVARGARQSAEDGA